MVPANNEMSEAEKDIFAKIDNNDVNGLKNILLQHNMKIDMYDEDGMTPLQHAAYKGNKEIVQMLIDQVSDIRNILKFSRIQLKRIEQCNNARKKVIYYPAMYIKLQYGNV
jgi:ankyrin repeat protein